MSHDRMIETARPIIVAVKGDPVRPGDVPRVELDLAKFHSGRWALQLDSAFAHRGAPAVILAEGVACLAVAWWAQLSPRSYMAMIHGAVFLSPLDVRFGQESVAASARLSPATGLPFPSVVVNTAYPFVDRVLALADGWGSSFVDTDSPLDLQATNRRGVPTDAAAQLLAFLPLLHAPEQPSLAPREPVFEFDTHEPTGIV
uniref:alpha/beta hydrolase n=1 Tax=uncultured Sphingomonas sp. TaxID=158754 RepID=UPI0035CB005E